MKNIVLNMDELSDSREVMESKEPASIRWFIIIVSAAILTAIIFSFYFEIDEYVKTPGEIKTMDIASNVTMTAGAKVDYVYIKEGDWVNKGDILFALDVEYANQKLNIVKNQCDTCSTKMDNLVLLRKSIEQDKNLFIETNYNEEFYYRFEQYKKDSDLSEQKFESSEQQRALNDEDNTNQLNEAKKKLKDKEALLSAYDYLLKCVKEDQSYDGDNSLVSAEYEEYSTNMQKAQLAYDSAKETYENINDAYLRQNSRVSVTSNDVAKAKNEADAIATTISRTTSDYLSEIDSKIALLSSKSGNNGNSETGNEENNEGTRDNDEDIIDGSDKDDEGSIIEEDTNDYDDEIVEEETDAKYEKKHNVIALSFEVSSEDENGLLTEYQMLKNAIISGEEYVCKYDEVRVSYNQYIEKISRLAKEYELKSATYNDLLMEFENQESSKVTQNDLNSAKYTYENAGIEVESLKNAFIAQIESNSSSLEIDISSLRTTINSLSTSLSEENNDDTQFVLSKEKNKSDYIVSINNEINSLNTEMLSYQSQITDLQDSIDNGAITASCDGTVTLLYDINNGDIIPAGTQLCTIVPSSDALKAVLLIPESDISKVSVGQNVEYIISSIPYNEFGRVSGTILSITVDSTSVQGYNSKYYLAQAEVPVHVLKNKEGEERTIQTGMLVEGKIICGSKKAIVWLLQKINLID